MGIEILSLDLALARQHRVALLEPRVFQLEHKLVAFKLATLLFDFAGEILVSVQHGLSGSEAAAEFDNGNLELGAIGTELFNLRVGRGEELAKLGRFVRRTLCIASCLDLVRGAHGGRTRELAITPGTALA